MAVRGSVRASGLEISYLREGSGPPLVLLHGYVGDARTWEPQLSSLGSWFTVVAWDAPGFGGSSDPPEGFGMDGYADCVAAFVGALDLGRPHLGGLSFGGGLALEVYRRHPALPRSLVLASAYAGWSGSLDAAEVRRRLDQAYRLADLPPDDLVAELLPTMFDPSSPPEAAERFGAMLRQFRPSGLRTTARCLAEADLRAVLPEIAVPTLLVYGDRDVRAPLEVARQLHDAVPGSRLAVIEGVGHICNLEAPQHFDAEVLAFLRGVGDRGGGQVRAGGPTDPLESSAGTSSDSRDERSDR